MRITITDKFLWDVYSCMEKAGDVMDFSLNARKRGVYLFMGENPIFKKYRHDKNKRRFDNLMYYLKSKGYIKINNLENKKALILTKEGVEGALKAGFRLNKKKRDDGKWTMLIFDIPESRRKLRSLLRSILRNAGFKILQKSVWISPYDTSEEIGKYLALYKLDNFVKIFLVEGV